MAITLPFVLMIIDFFPLGRFKAKGVLVEKLPFFFFSILHSLKTILSQHTFNAAATLGEYPLLSRLITGVRAYVFYLHKTIFPFNLAPYYPYPENIKLLSIDFYGPFLLLLVITVFCLLSLKRTRFYSALWLYYIITLIPVIGIIQLGSQGAADRFAYLPALGPFILTGIGAGLLFEKVSKKHLFSLSFAGILISIMLIAKTEKQIGIWKNSITLWSHEIKVFPDSIQPGFYHRALAYSRQGKYKRAVNDYSKAIEIDPGHITLYLKRGVLYGKLGKYNLAIKDFKRSLELDPKNKSAYLNLMLAYSKQKTLANSR